MGVEDLGTLDLSGADTSAGDFTPIPPATYICHVDEVTAVEIQKEGGNLPFGTPGYKVKFKVDEGPYTNRVVFNNYWVPGSDYDADKAKIMKGIFVNFLKALGYAEEEIMSGAFQADPNDWVGQQMRVSVGQTKTVYEDDGETVKYQPQNKVNGVKPLTAAGAATGGAAGVL